MDGIKCNTFCGRVKMSLLLQKGPKADRKKRLKVVRQTNSSIVKMRSFLIFMRLTYTTTK